MREFVVKKTLSFIKKYYPKYDNNKIPEIKYGLESIYILITKSIVILMVAFLLNIINELVVFLLFYNFVRLFSFGVHAGKSWICLAISLILFIGLPFLGKAIYMNLMTKSLLGILSLILMFIYAPADTIKRPIISKKRRIFLKYVSVLISILYVVLSLLIKDSYVSSNLILALLLQCFIISPLSYKVFDQPYNYQRNCIKFYF